MELLSPAKTLHNLILDKLGDKLSYEDRKQLLENVDIDFVLGKIEKLKRKERYGKVWMITLLIVMVTMIVTWGMTNGWDVIWSYVLSAGFMGVGYVGIGQYIDTIKTLTAWEFVEGFLAIEEDGDSRQLEEAETV